MPRREIRLLSAAYPRAILHSENFQWFLARGPLVYVDDSSDSRSSPSVKRLLRSIESGALVGRAGVSSTSRRLGPPPRGPYRPTGGPEFVTGCSCRARPMSPRSVTGRSRMWSPAPGRPARPALAPIRRSPGSGLTASSADGCPGNAVRSCCGCCRQREPRPGRARGARIDSRCGPPSWPDIGRLVSGLVSGRRTGAPGGHPRWRRRRSASAGRSGGAAR